MTISACTGGERSRPDVAGGRPGGRLGPEQIRSPAPEGTDRAMVVNGLGLTVNGLGLTVKGLGLTVSGLHLVNAPLDAPGKSSGIANGHQTFNAPVAF